MTCLGTYQWIGIQAALLGCGSSVAVPAWHLTSWTLCVSTGAGRREMSLVFVKSTGITGRKHESMSNLPFLLSFQAREMRMGTVLSCSALQEYERNWTAAASWPPSSSRQEPPARQGDHAEQRPWWTMQCAGCLKIPAGTIPWPAPSNHALYSMWTSSGASSGLVIL